MPSPKFNMNTFKFPNIVGLGNGPSIPMPQGGTDVFLSSGGRHNRIPDLSVTAQSRTAINTERTADTLEKTVSALEYSALSSERATRISIYVAAGSLAVAALSLAVTAYFAYQDYVGDEQWIKKQKLLAENRASFISAQSSLHILAAPERI